jgi:hypothetical protein
VSVNPYFDRLRQSFADQFEADGAEFIYRKNMKGVPIRVTSVERDGFVAAFNRRLRYLVWSVVPATFLLIGLLVLLVPDADGPLEDLATWIGLSAILAPYLIIIYWAWDAPARELEHRRAVGAALTSAEVRRLTFSRITYRHLGLAMMLAGLLAAKTLVEGDVLHSWRILWLIFAGLLIIGVAIQAIRKWRYERN